MMMSMKVIRFFLNSLIFFCKKSQFPDILEDIREECSKYGIVRSIEIPRPYEGYQVSGVGKVGVFIFQEKVLIVKNIEKN